MANLRAQPRQRRRSRLTRKLPVIHPLQLLTRSAAAHAASRASNSYSSNSAPTTPVARKAAFIFARNLTPAERLAAITPIVELPPPENHW